jgi:hypothetical protein
VDRKLRLAEFKVLYNAWRRYVVVFDNLLLGLLFWFEQKLIDNRIKTDLDAAIEQWETLTDSDMVSPVFTETPSETSESLSSVRITAPWYIDMYDER